MNTGVRGYLDQPTIDAGNCNRSLFGRSKNWQSRSVAKIHAPRRAGFLGLDCALAIFARVEMTAVAVLFQQRNAIAMVKNSS